MTRFFSLVAFAALSISLAPAANSYAFEPGDGDYLSALLPAIPVDQSPQDVCTLQLSSVISDLHGSNPDLPATVSASNEVAVASCTAQ